MNPEKIYLFSFSEDYDDICNDRCAIDEDGLKMMALEEAYLLDKYIILESVKINYTTETSGTIKFEYYDLFKVYDEDTFYFFTLKVI